MRLVAFTLLLCVALALALAGRVEARKLSGPPAGGKGSILELPQKVRFTGSHREGATQTALDRYLATPDPEFTWVDTGVRIDGVVSSIKHWTGYVLKMTSQRWLTDADSSCSLWEHDVVVIVPNNLDPNNNKTELNTVQFYIAGDSGPTGNLQPTDEDIFFAANLAVGTRSIGLALFQVPQQPCTFTADPKNLSRSEDAFIAFTWRRYLDLKKAGDPTAEFWPARLPMVKAAVRAMDTTQQFISQCSECGTQGNTPKDFLVYGASKRGWTTWLTGAVDDRVVAIAPIVMDALNFNKTFHMWYQSLGGWSFATDDYYVEDLFAEVDSPEMADLMGIIDPVVYKDRLADLPKLIVTGSNDEFFMPYDNHAWWDDMPGVKHLLIGVNADHKDGSWCPMTLPSMITWATGIMHKNPAVNPQLEWNSWFTGEGESQIAHLNVTLTLGEGSLKPNNVSVIYSHSDPNSNRIDFRWFSVDKVCQGPNVTYHNIDVCVHPYPWQSYPLSPVESSETAIHYTASMPAPSISAYGGFFVQFMFPGVTEGIVQYPLVVNTQVVIVPNTLPFPDCSGTACAGTLV